MKIILLKPEKDILEHLISGPKLEHSIKNTMFIDRLKQQGFIANIINEGKKGYIALTEIGNEILDSSKKSDNFSSQQPYVCIETEFKFNTEFRNALAAKKDR